VVDPWYQEALKKQEEVKVIKEKIKAVADKYQDDTDFIEANGQKVQLIKNKMVPIINKEVEGQLEEFEKAMHTVVKDNKLFVEVQDEIEEKIKLIRAQKSKKA